MAVQSENPLSIYFNERMGILTTHLLNTHRHFGEEDLHQLRVEIKKLRTLLRLLDVIIKEDYEKKKFDKTLSKLFKPGGKLRESQINITQANELNFDGVIGYQGYLDIKDKIQTEKLKLALDHFINTRLEQFKIELEEFINKTNEENFTISLFKFIKHEFKTIENIYPEISNNKIMHRARMHLKASGYMLNLAVVLWNDENLQMLYDKVKTAESMIGIWHDKIVFLKSLEKYADQELSPTEVHVLNSNADIVNQQVSQLYDEITGQLALLIRDDFALFNVKFPD